MTKREFLKKYRATIDEAITNGHGDKVRLNDRERWLWVQNDFGLYTLAKNLGVNV